VIDLIRTRNVGKMDNKGLPRFHFFHPKGDLGVQIKMRWLQCQGLVQFSPDFNGSGRGLPRLPRQIDVPAGHIDGHFDECCNAQDFDSMGWVVRKDFCVLGDLPLVVLGIHLKCNLSLPAGGDGLIKVGDRASSPRFDLLYLKGLVSGVKDFENMLNNLALLHLRIIDRFLLDDDSGACGFLSPGKGKIRNKTKCEQKYSDPKFLH
jgi:hypothetical protein